jgi:hypothetical protein
VSKAKADALSYLDDALDALTVEAWTAPASKTHLDEAWERVPPIQATLAIELERIDTALGPRGKSMFAPIAEEIKRAVIGIVAAQNALRQTPPGDRHD